MIDLGIDLDLAGWQAAKDFKEGDMSLLIERVRGREKLTEEEWQAVQHVLETAAAGKSWRPAHRLRDRKTEMLSRHLYRMFDYRVVHEGCERKRAMKTLADYAGLSDRRVEQMFDELDLSPPLGWRGNVALGLARKLYRDGVSEEEAWAKAAATMKMKVDDLKRRCAETFERNRKLSSPS